MVGHQVRVVAVVVMTPRSLCAGNQGDLGRSEEGKAGDGAKVNRVAGGAIIIIQFLTSIMNHD